MIIFDLNEALIEYCNSCCAYHLYTVWQSSDGPYYLQDADGDRIKVDYDYLKALRDSQEEVRASYLEQVVETGNDYLSLLFVPKFEAQSWYMQYAEDEQGVRFTRAKKLEHAGWLLPTDSRLPAVVRTYATGHTETTPYLGGIKTLDELIANLWDDILLVNQPATLNSLLVKAEIQVQRSASDIQESTRAAARKVLEEQYGRVVE